MSKTRNLSLLAGAAVMLGAFGNAYAVEGEGQAYTDSDEVRAIVANMMADADTRSSMMMQGGGGGYDDGFYLADSSGNFRLNIRGLVQFRYYLNFRDDDDFQDSNFESGFTTTRTRIGFDGYIIDPNLFYNVEMIAMDSDQHGYGGGEFHLQRAYVGYRWDNGFHLRWGQYRLQFLREDNVLPEYQLAIERSITNEAFRQGDVQGIELGYSAEDWRLFASFNDGLNTANTDISANPVITPVFDPITDLAVSYVPSIGSLSFGSQDIGLTARAEIRFAGTWEQFEDFTSMPGSEYGVIVGVAAHYQYTNKDRVTGGGDTQYFSWTADISVEGDGWNFFIAGIGGYTRFDSLPVEAGNPDDTSDYEPDDYGLVVQGGIFIPETDWEFFARYDAIFFDSTREFASDTFQTVTFGTNWYWSGHAAKFTLDVVWFIDDSNDATPQNTLVGYFITENNNQFTIRFQFQLMF